MPSDLLTNRPDIRQAEHELVAANADVGAARAAFFPRLSLTGLLGMISPAFSGLFKGDNHTWSFTPQISQPIFHGGSLRGELRLSEVRKSIAVAQYELAIQSAFREVSDGLAGRATYARQVSAQQAATDAAAKRARLADLRYRAGSTGGSNFSMRSAANMPRSRRCSISSGTSFPAPAASIAHWAAAIANRAIARRPVTASTGADSSPAALPAGFSAAQR